MKTAVLFVILKTFVSGHLLTAEKRRHNSRSVLTVRDVLNKLVAKQGHLHFRSENKRRHLKQVKRERKRQRLTKDQLYRWRNERSSVGFF